MQVEGGVLRAENTTFVANTANKGRGGSVAAVGGAIELWDCQLRGNSSLAATSHPADRVAGIGAKQTGNTTTPDTLLMKVWDGSAPVHAQLGGAVYIEETRSEYSFLYASKPAQRYSLTNATTNTWEWRPASGVGGGIGSTVSNCHFDGFRSMYGGGMYVPCMCVLMSLLFGADRVVVQVCGPIIVSSGQLFFYSEHGSV